MTVADLKSCRTYSECSGYKDGAKLGHNTYIMYRNNDDIAVKYHGTDIVTFHKDGTITVRTGGWDTVTTRGRLNQIITDHSVYSLDGSGVIEDASGTAYPLDSVVEINDCGEITNLAPVLADKLGAFLEKDISSKEEMLQTIKGLSLRQMEAVWKKFSKDRGILARNCVEEFLPLALASSKTGSEPWMRVVSDRLRKNVAA